MNFSGTTDTPQPLLLAVVEGAMASLAKLETTSATFLSVAEKERLLVDLVGLQRQVDGLLVDTLTVAADVAEAHGARTTTGWLAGQVNADDGEIRRLEVLGETCAERYPAIADRLRAGALSVSQAATITRALDKLGADVPAEVREAAIEQMLSFAAEFSPRELKRLGRGVLEFVDPAIFEDEERKRLEAELEAASEATRLRLWSHGEGATGFKGVVPDHVAARLRTYLSSLSNPRRDSANGGTPEDSHYLDPATGKRLSRERVLGEAFCALLESMDPERMPIQGGSATTVIVTMGLDTLLQGMGVATASGEQIPAGEARRLACNAGIVPAVLGGDSELLDLGRTKRLFGPAHRKAVAIRQATCGVEGCTVPVEQTELHHLKPWSRGGPTDLHNCCGLCRWHHQRVHDERYDVVLLPTGEIRLTLAVARLRT